MYYGKVFNDGDTESSSERQLRNVIKRRLDLEKSFSMTSSYCGAYNESDDTSCNSCNSNSRHKKVDKIIKVDGKLWGDLK